MFTNIVLVVLIYVYMIEFICMVHKIKMSTLYTSIINMDLCFFHVFYCNFSGLDVFPVVIVEQKNHKIRQTQIHVNNLRLQ